MIIFTFNGTSVDVTVEDALDHLDIIEKHYNGTFPSLVNPNIDSIQKEVKSLSMGVSSGE
ncbi:MAG: hypothetical protein KAZ87_13665 [Spirochaetes bacterium]|nr:hypothetical protein [Spirochaetota bacterium]